MRRAQISYVFSQWSTFEMRGTKEQDPLSLHFFVVVKEFAATTAKTYSQSNEKNPYRSQHKCDSVKKSGKFY